MATTPSTDTKTTAYSSGAGGGQSGPSKPTTRARKISDYGKQLQEKQKARREYGLRETQFRRYFVMATKSPIATGQALFTLLESRLDNVVFRLGLAKSRPMARQMVNHGLVRVNGKRLSIPSYTVAANDVITLKNYEPFEYNKENILPDWLSYNSKTRAGKVERLPKADDIVTDANPQLIIEYYSR